MSGRILSPMNVPMQQQAALEISAPMNDTQLVALVAAQAGPQFDAATSVKWAVEIVAQAVVQLPNLGKEASRLRREATQT